MILFSIVLPCYNSGKYIQSTINSILNQTYKEWEIVVVDNFSTDKTVEILKDYNDHRIKIHCIHNDGIIASSRNFGIKQAKGEWIAFIDSDDLWKENKLSVIADMITYSSADLFFHDMDLCDQDNKIIKGRIKGRKLKSNALHDLLKNGNCIANSSVVVKRQSILDVNFINNQLSMVGAEDYNTWLKIAAEGKILEYVPMVLGTYREHTGGISKKDMSLVMKAAVAPYEHLLFKMERNRLNSRILYTHLKHLSDHSKGKVKLKDSIFCFLYASFDIKIKTLFLLIKIW